MRPNLKVIYVAGIYHSGSTILDRSLSSLSNIVGLGEIHKFIIDGPEKLCSCGELAVKCPFWKNLLNLKCNYLEYYENIYLKFREIYGNKVILLDSSKTSPFKILSANRKKWQGLLYWISKKNVDLYCIHLTRDPCSWVSSLMRRDNKKDKKKSIIHYFLHRDYIRLIQWYLSNLLLSFFIKSNKIKNLNVNYEDFCNNPLKTVNKIAKFVQYNHTVKDINLLNSSSHIIVGNPSRNDPIINSRITLDERWKNEKRSSLFNLLFKIIR